MAYAPLTKIPQQFFDNLGNPLVSGTLYAYLAGTSTPTNMFSDNAGTVAGTSVVLDSRGEPTTFKLIWLNTAVIYKFILKDSTGTTIWTIDNISGDDGTGNTASSVFDQQTLTATAGQTLFTLGYSYVTGTNAMAVYKNGSRLITGTDFTETSSTSVTLTMAAIAGDEYTFIGGQDVSSSFSGTNVSFIQSGTGAVQRNVQSKMREIVSVTDFGADPTGVSDSTAALAAAFAAHNQLFFPEGTYLVDASGYPGKRAILYSTGVNNVVLSGYGATIKYKNGATGPIGLNFVEIVNATNALIEGLTFDGNRQNQNFGYDAIAFFGGKNLTVRDVYVKNMYRDGIYVRASSVNVASTYPERVLIDNVICDACGRNGASIIGANGITVQNSLFENMVGDPGAGIDVEPNASDIYGVRDLLIDNCTLLGNRGRGLVVTGNAPVNPGETPYCLNARITNIIANKNSAGQNASIKGSDIAVFYSEDIVIDGYSNTTGETQDPMDAGLIYIDNTAQRVDISNVQFADCNFPTNTKSLIYIDASNNDYRSVSNVYAVDCNAVVVSGGRYSDISGVFCQNCTGNDSVIVGTIQSSLRDSTLVSSSRVLAYNASGVGTVTVESLSVVNPTGDAIRIYANNSTFRDITVRNSGTAAARAIWIENITGCVLENWKVSDAGGYWATPSNAYLVSQASLSGNNIRNLFPSPLSGSATWNPASIASGGSASTTVSLMRSDVGDPCIVKHSVSLQGMMTFASTTSANTATVTLFNPTGGAIDLASHTVSVEAIK
jgi:hypothetical protein